MTRFPTHFASPMTACAVSPSDPPFEASLVDLHGLDAPFAAKSAADPGAHAVFQRPQVQNAAIAAALSSIPRDVLPSAPSYSLLSSAAGGWAARPAGPAAGHRLKKVRSDLALLGLRQEG